MIAFWRPTPVSFAGQVKTYRSSHQHPALHGILRINGSTIAAIRYGNRLGRLLSDNGLRRAKRCIIARNCIFRDQSTGKKTYSVTFIYRAFNSVVFYAHVYVKYERHYSKNVIFGKMEFCEFSNRSDHFVFCASLLYFFFLIISYL